MNRFFKILYRMNGVCSSYGNCQFSSQVNSSHLCPYKQTISVTYKMWLLVAQCTGAEWSKSLGICVERLMRENGRVVDWMKSSRLSAWSKQAQFENKSPAVLISQPIALKVKMSQVDKKKRTADTSQIRRSTVTICAICLQSITPKRLAISIPCLHKFCFSCLIEWSKVRTLQFITGIVIVQLWTFAMRKNSCKIHIVNL